MNQSYLAGNGFTVIDPGRDQREIDERLSRIENNLNQLRRLLMRDADKGVATMATIQLHKKSDGSVIDIDPTTIAGVRPIPGSPAVPAVAAIPATPDYSIVVLAGGLAAQSFVEVTETAAEVTAMLAGATGATGPATPPRGRG